MDFGNDLQYYSKPFSRRITLFICMPFSFHLSFSLRVRLPCSCHFSILSVSFFHHFGINHLAIHSNLPFGGHFKAGGVGIFFCMSFSFHLSFLMRCWSPFWRPFCVLFPCLIFASILHRFLINIETFLHGPNHIFFWKNQ